MLVERALAPVGEVHQIVGEDVLADAQLRVDGARAGPGENAGDALLFEGVDVGAVVHPGRGDLVAGLAVAGHEEELRVLHADADRAARRGRRGFRAGRRGSVSWLGPSAPGGRRCRRGRRGCRGSGIMGIGPSGTGPRSSIDSRGRRDRFEYRERGVSWEHLNGIIAGIADRGSVARAADQVGELLSTGGR